MYFDKRYNISVENLKVTDALIANDVVDENGNSIIPASSKPVQFAAQKYVNVYFDNSTQYDAVISDYTVSSSYFGDRNPVWGKHTTLASFLERFISYFTEKTTLTTEHTLREIYIADDTANYVATFIIDPTSMTVFVYYETSSYYYGYKISTSDYTWRSIKTTSLSIVQGNTDSEDWVECDYEDIKFVVYGETLANDPFTFFFNKRVDSFANCLDLSDIFTDDQKTSMLQAYANGSSVLLEVPILLTSNGYFNAIVKPTEIVYLYDSATGTTYFAGDDTERNPSGSISIGGAKNIMLIGKMPTSYYTRDCTYIDFKLVI